MSRTIDPTEAARSARLRMYNVSGFKRIVFVDNEFEAIPDEAFADLVAKHGARPLADAFPSWKEDTRSLDDREANGFIQNAYRRLQPAERENVLSALRNRSKPLAGVPTWRSLFEPFNGTQYLELAPNEWMAKKNALVSDGVPTLYIFDLHLTNGGHEGARELDWLFSKDGKAAAILFSRDFEDTPEKDATKIASIAERFRGLTARTIIPLSKQKFRDNPAELVYRIQLVLLREKFEKFNEECGRELTQAFQDAKKELDGYVASDFAQMVFRSSFKEGEWPPFTWYRVFQVYLEDGSRAFVKNAKLHQICDDVQRLIGVQDIPSADRYQRVFDFEHKEYFTESDVLSATHSPTSLGDIYQDENDGSLHILLVQPCDLAVRSDGKRNGRVRDGVLVQLIPTTKQIIEGEAETSFEYESILPPMGSDGTRLQVDFRKSRRVHLGILDFCVLSADGRATIRADDPAPEKPLLYTIEALRIRLNKAWHASLEGVLKLDAALSSLEAPDRQTILLNSLDWYHHRGNATALIDTSDRRLTFRLRRVRRLREDVAASLLVQFHQFCSRDAHPHALTRGVGGATVEEAGAPITPQK